MTSSNPRSGEKVPDGHGSPVANRDLLSSDRPPVRSALGAGDAAAWGMVMRACLLGGRRARAFGTAGMI